MKIRTVVIAFAVTAAIAGGISYGVDRYSRKSQKKPVNVVPVANVNFGYWGDDAVSYGSIISRDSQSVSLNTEYELLKVYVETGDEVKIGDPLLEYDMTLTELKNEMEILTKQSMELNLQSMEKELKKLQNTRPTASLAVNFGVMTASEDGLFEDMGIVEVDNPDAISQDEFIQEFNNNEEGDGNENLDIIPGDESEGADSVPDDKYEGENNSPEDDLIIEDGSEDDFMNDEDSSDEDQIIEGDDSFDDDFGVDEMEIVTEINNFLTRVNLLSVQELDALIEADIREALRIYREKLAVFQSKDLVDYLGEKREVYLYSLNPSVAASVGEGTSFVLEQAYDRVCFYQFVYCMRQLNPDHRAVEEMTDEEIRSLESEIRTSVAAYYDMRENVLAGEEYKESLAALMEELGAFIARLNHMDVVEETEPSTEPMPDFPGQDDFGNLDDFGDYGDFGDYSDEMTYTAEELKEAIAEQERSIVECKLDIRETELKIKQYTRELENKIVRSTMNGVVKEAGTLDDTVIGEAFIVITGETGMYVQGTINELKLEEIELGDIVQGTSYETGIGFSAAITEISPYPVNSDNFYFGYSSENSNSSYYPFLAYIEDAEGLTEGEVELKILEDTPSTGVYLEKYFLLEEANGKEYVYIQGKDGLLKKQYVETGITVYGMAKEIKRGVSMNDKIAFPYGKNVVEGASTIEVDSLYEDYMYY